MRVSFSIRELPETLGSMVGMTDKQPEATILVVDDEPSIRELLSASLRFAGFDVLAAADGREALDHQSGAHIDIAVLDIMLPTRTASRFCAGSANTTPSSPSCS